MNLTIGFIAIFISIVIPGILFRRFFYFGEFSKQFNTKDPVLHSIFFSVIPGIVIQILAFTVYNLSLGFNSSFLDVFTIFRDITSESANDTKEATKNFINNDISIFFLYSVFVFVFASVSGWLSSRLIRIFSWDKKFKLFRFGNQWYYIFSGEVLNMKKFQDAHNFSYKKNKGQEQDTLLTYADILVSVSEQNEKKELYSGYVVDYDLKSDDISQLDKVYLFDTHRYKKTESTNDSSRNDEMSKNHLTSRNKVKVPGDIFVLNAKNILNINLTYIPSPRKRLALEKKEAAKTKFFESLHLIAIFVIIFVHIFYKILNLEKTIFAEYFVSTGFWQKSLSIVFINQILLLFLPYDNKEMKSHRSGRIRWTRIFSLLFWFALFYWFVLKRLVIVNF